jgi:hypothetical protein
MSAGRSRPGEEILGFTAALLYVGDGDRDFQRNPSGGRCRRQHDDRLPSAARGGARPAQALAEAALTEEFSPFVCFGGG